MDLDKQLLGAKVKIKTWEKQFIRLNLRVPESADIKTAPADIRAAYVAYFRYKKRQSEADVAQRQSSDDSAEVWGEHFNVKHREAGQKAWSTQERFADKIKKTVLSGSPLWRSGLGKQIPSLAPCQTENETPVAIEIVKERKVSCHDGNPSAAQLETGHNSGENNLTGQSVDKLLDLDNDLCDTAQAADEANDADTNSPPLRGIGSPVKAQQLMKHRAVFLNRNLNADWLERNADISEVSKKQPEEVTSSMSPSAVLETKMIPQAGIRIKLSQIKNFQIDIKSASEVDEAIKNAKNATIAGHSDAELGETLEKQEIRPTDDVISFEDEFAQQMKGRSDTANVRRMKTHHKFNAQTKPVEDAVLDKEEIVIDWKVVDHDWQDDIELETEHTPKRQGSRIMESSLENREDNGTNEDNKRKFISANSPEKHIGTPASRNILDPFQWNEQERRDESTNQPVRQLYPKEKVRVAETDKADVKELRKKGVKVHALAKRQLEIKPQRTKTKKLPPETTSSVKIGRKRARNTSDDLIGQSEEEIVRRYTGAEGSENESQLIDGAVKRAKMSVKSPDDYEEDCSGSVSSKPIKMTSIERRMTNGTLNENFVKANLRKKTYSRGLKKLNFKKYKFEQWKQAKQESQSGLCSWGEPDNDVRMSKVECFKCGGFGHWARYCVSKATSAQENNEPPEEIHIPTLEEAAALAKGIRNAEPVQLTSPKQNQPTSSRVASAQGSAVLRLCVAEAAKLDSHELCSSEVKSSQFEVDETEEEIEQVMSRIPLDYTKKNDTTDSKNQGEDARFKTIVPLEPIDGLEVKRYLHELGFQEFRPGQEAVVNRILKGQSTLMVSSTGSGKSLCYQLPAYIYANKMTCVTLVVSPLISLMEDQVTGLPGKLKAVYLHSGITPQQREKTIELIKEGQVHAVLVSPEAVVAAGQGGSLLAGLPPIAFACIDEAHCLSEWSHNFRPSYLQLHKTLRERLGVQCVLALTATATRSTCKDIAHHLQIDQDGVVGLFKLPDNLVLTASKELDRDRALINLFKSERFSSCNSIIVYTTRRDETERLAALIRTSMQDKLRTNEQLAKMKRQRNKARDVLCWDAEAYHAGLTPAKRKSVQNKFMRGQIRVVVATVAFGMGIDKADIRAVIHYNMPKSFENYVQEAGRAGRDGQRSDCHLFLEFKNEDRNDIKRHIFADSTDRFVLRKFLEKVFEPMKRLKDAIHKMPHYEVALNIEQMIEYLDMKEENILTLMCFLESHPNKFIQLKHRVYGTATVKCYGGPSQFASLVKTSPALAAALALKKKFGELKDDEKPMNTMSFPVVEVATFMGWDSRLVKRDLKKLEWDDSRVAAGGSYRKTGVIVEFSDICFHLYVSSDLGNLDEDEVLEYLLERITEQEKLQLERLTKVFSAFKHVALQSGEGDDEVDIERSNRLKWIIENYFNEEPLGIEVDEDFNKASTEDIDEDYLRGDIRSLIHSQPDQTFTGRAIARIMHGIASPNYPAQVWGRLRRVWRSHLEVDFQTLVRIANNEIVRWRSGINNS
ncbi:uncharacterized protein LOC111271328 [Varroa jacobsoni]|uniref:uncharacterized protein LOC111271328 n=1 Tax=Varroa jacobsoni TaxID=62625 RepID=UPI000BF8A78E|nr:uncharacterized protein LOC111271328 [Varroa jacobsoni]